METFRLDCTLEWDGLVSDPMTLTVSVTGEGAAAEGTGSFAMPARFIGTAMRSETLPRAVAHDGAGFEIEVTRFDMLTGIAFYRTVGELPFALRRRA